MPLISQRHCITQPSSRCIRPRCLQPISLTQSDDGGPSPTLRSALFNARSISNKSFILNEFFIREKLDFMFVTETWQRENEFIHLNELCPTGCSVIGSPRLERRGGGLAVVHRNSHLCRVIQPECFSSFESQIIKTGSTNIFYCVLIYRPPGPAGPFLTDFTHFLSSIIKFEKVLIVGDFNLHIDDITCNMAAEFLSITDSFNFTQHVSESTHTKGHILDLVFSLGLNIENVSLEDLHVSDHSCVCFDLIFPRDPPPPKMKARRRIITQDVVERFSASFDPCLLSGYDNPEVLIQSFNSYCLTILDEVAPVKSNYVSQKKHRPWLNDSILSLKRKCRRVERIWKSTRLEAHRLHLRELMTSLNEMLKTARTQYFSKLISLNKNNPRLLFDTINSIVSPATPHVPVSSKTDSNDFLHYFVNKIRDIRSNIPPSICSNVVPDQPLPHTWSSLNL